MLLSNLLSENIFLDFEYIECLKLLTESKVTVGVMMTVNDSQRYFDAYAFTSSPMSPNDITWGSATILDLATGPV